MSDCECCLPAHPTRLLERLHLSIQTVKLIRSNCSIFEMLLMDEYEHFERLTSSLNRYLMHYGSISEPIFAHLSRWIVQINARSEVIVRLLHELECLTNQCSVWVKRNTGRATRSQLKRDGKRLDALLRSHAQRSSSRKLSADFSTFRESYERLCLQMDSIERDHLKLFVRSGQLFSLIVGMTTTENSSFVVQADQHVNEWKEKNRFHIPWLPDTHHQVKEDKPTFAEPSDSEIDIKSIDGDMGDVESKLAYESNLSWSFTFVEKEELPLTGELEVLPIEDTVERSSALSSRVRQAIEAIERKTGHFPRERKS